MEKKTSGSTEKILKLGSMEEISKHIEEFLNSAQIERAVRLALSGDLVGAEAIIKPLVEDDPNHENLDLYARIKIQKGELSTAKELWEKALQKKPLCTDCQNALRKLNEIEKNRVRQDYFLARTLRNAILGLLILGIIGTMIYIFAQRKRINDLSSQIEAAQSQIAAFPSQVGSDPGSASTQQIDIVSLLQNNNSQLLSVATQIADLQQATVTNAEQAGFTVDEITLDIPGVNTSIQNGKLTITFAEGLFRFENVYTPFGWQTIRQLGYQLEPWVGKIMIAVIGFTDDQEKEAAYLGLERALMVVKTLDQNSQIPLGIFTIQDANNRPAPFPNDSLNNRGRNRTVMFIVSPALP